MKFQKKKFSKKKTRNEFKSSGLQQEWESALWNDESSKQNNLDEEEKLPKWYEEFPGTPERIKDLTDEEIAALKEEAHQVLKDETAFYHSNKEKRKQGSDQSWIKTVLQKGTASDKVAAHILKVQESPAFNLSSLVTLVNMVRVSKKEFTFVLDDLAELFISDLLPPNLKLRLFERQPLDRLGELSSGNAMARRKRLAFWAFEDELKKLYIQLIHSLNIIARDSVEANKEKAVSILYRLLASHPEQEDTILSMLVNKLGDPSRKVVSKVTYSLNQLLRVHEGMKQVVMNEVERLLFRPNVSVKTQYYAICFLSQFNFTINDDQVACNIISIYFAFFRACVKKGDINSRMLASLLMGLNRAYPYGKKKLDSLTDHINTLYKLVHLANFNISLHCLIILFQISDSSEDRFYCALYRKLSDLSLATSSHQAMFINLLYKAFMADNNIGRIKTFIKRILQLCGLMPVPLACGLLYLVSQLINKRKVLMSVELRSHLINEKFGDAVDDEDEEERYIDVDKQLIDDYDVKKEDEDLKNINSTINVNSEEIHKKESEDSTAQTDSKEERKPCASWYHSSFKKRKYGFDPLVRNPAFAEGELAVFTELALLTRHFHPTVALFASNILEDKVITYTGDPLVDFTLVRFIERFVFKNPKKITPGSESKGPDPVLAPRKYYTPSGAKALPTNSRLYLEQNETDVPIDELFLYRYLHQRQQLGYKITKREPDDDVSDIESVASEEFEEMLNSMMSKKGDIDFADDIGDNLSKKASKKSKKRHSDDGDIDDIGDDEDIEEDEEEDFDDDGDEDDDDDMEDEEDEMKNNIKGSKNTDSDEGLEEESDIDLDDIDDSDAEVMDFDESDDEEEEEDVDNSMKGKSRRNKKGSKINMKKLKNDISGLFAPAEQFSEMLEEAGTSGYKVGTAHALSNKDRAAEKQLQWEMKRNDSWMKGKKRRKPNNFKSSKRRK